VPEIPEPVKRQVRQHDGFGYCECGFPIIEYHHIVKDSRNPEDIMLLCPIHHHEATVGAMLLDSQRSLKSNPFNITRGLVEGTLKVNQKTPVLNLGTNQFVGDGDFILIDGESMLSLEIRDSRLELSMKLYDQNDTLVAEVKGNEWISGNPLPWDLESKFQWLRIRRKQRDIQLEIDARKDPLDLNADIWRQHQQFHLASDRLLFNGVVRDFSMINLCLVGMRLEVDSAKGTFQMSPDPRYGEGAIVSNADVKERVRNGLLAWERLTCEHAFVAIVKTNRYTVNECSKCKKIVKIWT
jgi:hypothetical protein